MISWCPRPLKFDLIATGLQSLLNTSGEEILHLALECLTAVIKADAAAAAAMEPHLSPRLLALWSKHIHDPLLSIDAVEAIEALAKIPSILPSLQVGTGLMVACDLQRWFVCEWAAAQPHLEL